MMISYLFELENNIKFTLIVIKRVQILRSHERHVTYNNQIFSYDPQQTQQLHKRSFCFTPQFLNEVDFFF
jgi:hypothetical protein